MSSLQYDRHNWIICVDPKIACLFFEQQRGYTKYICFLCMWDTRAREKHWDEANWPLRPTLKPEDPNILHEPLDDRNNIIFLLLHIKLGIMNQFVKALPTDGDSFKYIAVAVPRLSIEKIKAGVFDGPQIRQLIKDKNFTGSMTVLEKHAWLSIKDVVKNFLGNTRVSNYNEKVQKLLESYKALGCNMSIKLHFLHCQLPRKPWCC